MEQFRHAEIEITSNCDMECFACDRFMDVSQTKPMSIYQIGHFLKDSKDNDWPWERFHILGGEPTLHPHFMRIMEMFLDYKEKHQPNLLLRVISNGSGKLMKYKQWLLVNGVEVNVESKSKKRNPPAYFRNIHCAPIDEEEHKDSEIGVCSIFGIKGCGIGVTSHGMYLCGAGAGVARIAGLPIGVMHLKDLTLEAMHNQAKQICRICGHWNSHLREIVTTTAKDRYNSPFWEEAIKQHKANPPIMPVYGEPE